MEFDFVILLVVACLAALPIIAIVRSNRITEVERRLARVERALWELKTGTAEKRVAQPAPRPPPVTTASPVEIVTEQPQSKPQPPLLPIGPTVIPPTSESLEVVIGRRWVALAAIALIVGATAFFLKYAFENGWIGELGRVTLGVIAGLTLVWIGHNRSRKGWRYLSQMLIGGGITVLYLSIYAAFAYYQLIDQRSAFIILAIVVAEAHLLAMAYNAPAIAVLALTGGFLVPILLSTGHDQYLVLFTYIAILDIGMLGIAVSRRWPWIGSIAYIGTQLLFWAWYTEHYHPEKRLAALFFQFIIFMIFVAADLAPNLRREAAGLEELLRLVLNPLVFYATWFSMLNDDNHVWMATLAVALAIVYSGLARFQMDLCAADRRVGLVLLATALTFVTIAIPVQLKSNWVAIAWSVEALLLLWASLQIRPDLLRWFSIAGFVLAIGRFLFIDTPWGYRAPFTPVFNKYFLGAGVLIACLTGAARLLRQVEENGELPVWRPMPLAFAAFGVLLLSSSIEAYTYFAALATTVAGTGADAIEMASRLLWAAKLSLSVLWSIYAGLLIAAGFRLRLQPLRIAGLCLFGITLAKVALIDTAELRQFYRIIALLVLGLVLLTVAWAYQRIPRREEVQ